MHMATMAMAQVFTTKHAPWDCNEKSDYMVSTICLTSLPHHD